MNTYEMIFILNGINSRMTVEADSQEEAANMFSRIMTKYISKKECKPFGAKNFDDLRGRHDKEGHVFIVTNFLQHDVQIGETL